MSSHSFFLRVVLAVCLTSSLASGAHDRGKHHELLLTQGSNTQTREHQVLRLSRRLLSQLLFTSARSQPPPQQGMPHTAADAPDTTQGGNYGFQGLQERHPVGPLSTLGFKDGSGINDGRGVDTTASPNSCPDGSSPVKCLVNPCNSKDCGPGYTCETDYCNGCRAVCKPGQLPNTSVHEKGLCADGSAPIHCLVDPCQFKECGTDEVCEASYCGGCNALCKQKDSSTNHSIPLAGSSSPCPDGSPQVKCLISPCRTTKCGDSEVCEANYCGGCNAVCKPVPVLLGSNSTNSSNSSCLDGSQPVNCLVDPCKEKKCAAGEVCEANYCGGCNAICLEAPSQRLLNRITGRSTPCSDGSRLVNCFVDPCRFKKCPAGEVCEATYCGGCNAVCKAPGFTGHP